MEILVERKWKKDAYTVGRMYINGKFYCNTLEDPDRGLKDSMSLAEIKSKKIYGNIALPTGKYNVVFTYSPKFRRKLPLLENVKGYDGIRIHSGNTAKDTLGCILVGENKEKGKVLNSRKWSDDLNTRISQMVLLGQKVTIEIK